MRLLHTMLRVGDLQRSIAFYTNVLGMKLLRTSGIRNTNTRWPLWDMVRKRKKRSSN